MWTTLQHATRDYVSYILKIVPLSEQNNSPVVYLVCSYFRFCCKPRIPTTKTKLLCDRSCDHLHLIMCIITIKSVSYEETVAGTTAAQILYLDVVLRPHTQYSGVTDWLPLH